MRPQNTGEPLPPWFARNSMNQRRSRLHTRLPSMLQFPNFRVFPRNIDRVVKMLQQAFAAVEEAEAGEVVVDECAQRPDDNINQAFALAPGDRSLRAERGVVVHVLDVV